MGLIVVNVKSEAPAKIWVLFSVQNNYDQPDYNLVWWNHQKPSIEELGLLIFDKDFSKLGNEEIVMVASVWKGDAGEIKAGMSSTQYRLREIAPGLTRYTDPNQ